MYALIRIGVNDFRDIKAVSKRKNLIEKQLRKEGYYWSIKFNRYINDHAKNKKEDDPDYIIERVDEITEDS